MVEFKHSGFRENLKHFVIINRRGIALFIHAIVLTVAYFLAFAIRFDGVIPSRYFSMMGQTLFAMVICKLVIFHYFHLHHGLLRYSGITDLVRLIKATSVSNLLFVAVIVFAFHTEGFPRSVFVLDWLTTIVLFGGMKMSLRLWREMRQKKDLPAPGHSARTLIIGAGDAGDMAVRELNANRSLAHEIVGFVDDDPAKEGMEIHGIPVLGKLAETPHLIKEEEIDEVLIAMPSVGRKVIQNIVDSCSTLDVRLRILPAMSDLITGEICVQAIREVKVEDLLCRPPVKFDLNEVENDIKGKVVLITGAAGSIGSEIARQVTMYMPANIILVDNAETPLFEIMHELRRDCLDLTVTPVIADVKDANAIDNLFSEYRPQRVYHAAAYKHVPLMESFPCQAILNNVKGTRVLGLASIRHEVERFVLISTDKAVRPGNVMGATKRLCELLVNSMSGGKTSFSAVRFGNVLGSNGSVIPVFRKQIEAGGPVTVTHPQMTRYFMTIPEAVSLVLQCGAMSVDDRLFVLDMGTPVKIMDLAENMISLSGLKIGEDIDIKITDLRPGEKLHEELVTYGEELEQTYIPKINLLKNSNCSIAPDVLLNVVRNMEFYARRGNDEAVKSLLRGVMMLDQQVCENDLHSANSRQREIVMRDWNKIIEDAQAGGGSSYDKKILIVDHDPKAVEIIKNLLEIYGCSAIQASCGYEALEVLGKEGKDVSMVISELCLIDFPASQLKERVHEMGINAVFVPMRYPDVDDTPGDEEFDFVLEKPFGIDEIERMMEVARFKEQG